MTTGPDCLCFATDAYDFVTHVAIAKHVLACLFFATDAPFPLEPARASCASPAKSDDLIISARRAPSRLGCPRSHHLASAPGPKPPRPGPINLLGQIIAVIIFSKSAHLAPNPLESCCHLGSGLDSGRDDVGSGCGAVGSGCDDVGSGRSGMGSVNAGSGCGAVGSGCDAGSCDVVGSGCDVGSGSGVVGSGCHIVGCPVGSGCHVGEAGGDFRNAHGNPHQKICGQVVPVVSVWEKDSGRSMSALGGVVATAWGLAKGARHASEKESGGRPVAAGVLAACVASEKDSGGWPVAAGVLAAGVASENDSGRRPVAAVHRLAQPARGGAVATVTGLARAARNASKNDSCVAAVGGLQPNQMLQE